VTPRASLLDLAFVFGRVSATAFGGSSIPMMRRAVVEERKWFTEREFLEIYALAQVCPGGIPITIAILCGKRLAGVPGFFVALVAETLPGFLVLMVLAVLSLDPHATVLRAALRGASAAALGAMVANAIQMSWPFRTKPVDVVLMALVATAVIVFHFTLWYVFLLFLPLAFALLRLSREV
jgi:chromate transporter